MENLESRVTDLEIQITHQTRTVEELNSVLISQQKQIAKIETINNFLLQALKNVSESDNQILSNHADQKPPHY